MKRVLLFCVLIATLPCLAWGVEQGVAVLPYWVLNPNKPGYLSVVGEAQKQEWGGREAQYRVALMKARQELAQMIRVKVTSSAQIKFEQKNEKLTQDADTETTLQSSVELQLGSARVIEEWGDPQTGNLYIWLVTPSL